MSEFGFLLDTNIVSEGRRKRPDAGILAFMQSIQTENTFISVLTMGELRKGVVMRGRTDRHGAEALSKWVNEIEATFADRILPVDLPVAGLWGELAASRPRTTIDTLIAATAIIHSLTLVTRNVRDVADTGVKLINPWAV